MSARNISTIPPTFTVSQLAERTLHRRAVEVVIWGMPAVNYDLLYQAMVKAKGAFNQVVYWSRLPDWKNQTLTPNPDTLYFVPFINTKDVGPVVLEDPSRGRRLDHGKRGRLLADRHRRCRTGRRR